MREAAAARMLPDGRRLHLHHGPIDAIAEAFGSPHEVRKAYHAAAQRFVTVLHELCEELTLLRQDGVHSIPLLQGRVAQRMADGVQPFAQQVFITPMAAVAGAVAEEILEAMTAAATLTRAYVNDGGDIALHLTPGESFRVGLVERPEQPSLLGTAIIPESSPVRGIATSGSRGRSFSLGIADAVTILADRAAVADAAATIVANGVDLPGHPGIVRVPAREIAPDSDLGDRLVTRAVGRLTPAEIEDALAAGAEIAGALIERGVIRAAALNLCGENRIVGSASVAAIAAAGAKTIVATGSSSNA
jgi:ApbE superfamily uncharacterized protein (UPF0280 family)